MENRAHLAATDDQDAGDPVLCPQDDDLRNLNALVALELAEVFGKGWSGAGKIVARTWRICARSDAGDFDRRGAARIRGLVSDGGGAA